MTLNITVQKASNVFKAVPGAWHTITSRIIDGNKETATTRIVQSMPSVDWINIEKARNYHWLQVSDVDGFRKWISKRYFNLFDRRIREDNFLIVDLYKANSEIFPRTFRCQLCKTLMSESSDYELLTSINILNRSKDGLPKLGLKCPKCNHRPITQQPHVIIDYEQGIISELPTICPRCSDHLKLDFRGSPVSILGWRLSCNNPSCSLSHPIDPFDKDQYGHPFYDDFYNRGRRLSITPSTRGPSRSIVEVKIDTTPFNYKPNECLLSSIFEIHEAPEIEELKEITRKLIDTIVDIIRKALGGQLSEEDCEKYALGLHGGDPAYADALKMMLEDPRLKSISMRSDESGKELMAILLSSGIEISMIDEVLRNIKSDLEEPINLLFADGITYEDFIANNVRESDPRKKQLKQFVREKSDLHIEDIRYIYPGEGNAISSDRNGFQIVKASFGVDNGLADNHVRIPFHNINPIQARTKNKTLIRADDSHPLIYATNHPIEGIFIRINPKRMIDQGFINNQNFESPRLNIALALEDELKVIETMLHTFSHIMIRRLSNISGLSSGSLSHKIFPHDCSILIYTTIHPTLGQLQELFENKMSEFLNHIQIKQMAMNCPRDPICIESQVNPGSCFACLHIPEYSCSHYWNENLNRILLWNPIKGSVNLWN
jgi:hypothetical protein